eukprot:CAMPEP_0201553196 /NCGR_PEP_ID=MMETSP0173_2-20130828/19497_1 /ASSEMBLY_ACC=CAM_ASM_000268 /TAXON_ID=218659 /ORGANISM="Vexillifera sp., Strain DIVA3 564/2" /LENGTH=518 /DNA_ID=CAMNT_0047963821 /DNA_START=28 /DNA_END=1581 /DNA_ORIENTATION=+
MAESAQFRQRLDKMIVVMISAMIMINQFYIVEGNQVEQEKSIPSITNTRILERTLESEKNVLVLFTEFTNDCYYCKQAEQSLNKVLTQLEENVVKVLQVNCLEQEEICLHYNVELYPVLKLFSEGLAIYDYEGALDDAQALFEFIVRFSGEKVTTINSVEAFNALLDSEQVIIMGLFLNQDKRWRVYRRTAAVHFSQFSFYEMNPTMFSNDMKLYEQLSTYKGKNGVVLCLRKRITSIDVIPFKGRLSRQRLLSWLEDVSFSRVVEATTSNLATYAQRGLPVLTLWCHYDEEKDPDCPNGYIPILEDIATEYGEQMTFIISRAEYLQSGKRIGIDKHALPALSIFDMKHSRNFVYDTRSQAITHPLVLRWVERFLAKQLTPFLLSSDEQADPSSPLKVLSYNTFPQFMKNHPDDYLFILFHLSSCEFSQHFASVIEELAERNVEQKNVFFASLDLDTNRSPSGVSVFNFPSFWLFHGGRITAKFQGPRTLEFVQDWVQQQTTMLKQKEENDIHQLQQE